MQYKLCESLDEVRAIPSGTLEFPYLGETVLVEVYQKQRRQDGPIFVGEEKLLVGALFSGTPFIETEHSSMYLFSDWDNTCSGFTTDEDCLRIFRSVAE